MMQDNLNSTSTMVLDLEDHEAIELIRSAAVSSPLDRKSYSEKLLSDYNLSHLIPIELEEISESGCCIISFGANPAYVHSFHLNGADIRSVQYQLKTLFHELFHSRIHALMHDYNTLGEESWIQIEEVAAETSSHAILSEYGYKSEVCCSYPSHLTYVLPKLKRIPEFKDCVNFYDFGVKFLKYRFHDNFRTGEWQSIYQQYNVINVEYDQYMLLYKDYVFMNIYDIAEVIYNGDNSPNKPSFEKDSMIDLIVEFLNDGWFNNEFDNYMVQLSVAISMNRIGVK